MIHHSPHRPYPHPTALSQQGTLIISLTHGTRYESHPPEVKLGKVVSGLLRGVDVLFAEMTGNALFPGTQETRRLVQPSDTFQSPLVDCIFWARLVKEISSANQQGFSPHLPFLS